MSDSRFVQTTLQALCCKPITYGVVQTGVHIPDGVPCVRVVDLTKPKLSLSSMIRTSPEINRAYRRTILESNEILFALRGEIGHVKMVPAELVGANITRGIARISPDTSAVCPRFLLHAIQSPRARLALLKRVNGSALQEIPIGALRTLRIDLPTKPEQQLIASVLDHWDDAIGYLVRVLKLKRHLKRGLMQQLLTGRRRFQEFSATSWREVRIGEVLREQFRPVTWDDAAIYRLASVRRASRGLFWREPLYGRQIQVKKLHTIRSGEFLMSHIQAAYGAMAVVPDEFDGAHVSDMYTILTPVDQTKIDIRFFGYLAERPEMRHAAYVSSNGFFAERLRLNFDPHDFLRRKIAVPATLAEQQRIVAVLSAADREIGLLEQQLATVRDQKKGLMQKLLTGNVRLYRAASNGKAGSAS